MTTVTWYAVGAVIGCPGPAVEADQMFAVH